MPSRHALRPAPRALSLLALVAALTGGALWWTTAGWRDCAVDLEAAPRGPAAEQAAAGERAAPAEPAHGARAQLPLELPAPSESVELGPDAVRLRFVRGTTGVPVPDLAVFLLEPAADAPGATPGGATLLASGRTNAHGLLFGPASLREQRFALELDSSDGLARTASPNAFGPESFPADGSVLEIHVLGAWAAFEAVVQGPRGEPVAGAEVQFDFESPAFAFSTQDAPSTRVATNSEGVARIELVDPASSGGRMRIKAEQGELRSEVVELPPPLRGARVVLRLSTSASALVRARNAAGSPLAGAMARIERLDAPYTSVGRSTDRDGHAKFGALEPGRYAASVDDPATRASRREEFSLASCQIAEVTLTLPQSELPLAVAGGVRDAEGKPLSWLWVTICVDGREEARLALDRDGRFEYHRAPCERLRVRVQASFDGPVIAPEVVDAPFGARDLAFVLSDAPRMGFTALRVVDRESGLPLGGAAAAVFRDSAAERIGGVVSALAGSALSLASNEDGLLFVPSGPQLPRARLVVEKRGYVRRELDLSDLSSLPVLGERPTLELSRGYVHRWIVLDARTLAPVSGAIATHGVDPFTGLAIEDGSRWPPSAPSDERGVLELSLPEAPRRVSIQAPGYLPRAVEAGLSSQILGATLSLGDSVLLEAQSRR